VNQNGVNILDNSIDNTAELWVQKYKPNRYLDLLSDESTNRMLLHWLKIWDKVVFNKEVNKKRKVIDVFDKSAGIFLIAYIIFVKCRWSSICPLIKWWGLCWYLLIQWHSIPNKSRVNKYLGWVMVVPVS